MNACPNLPALREHTPEPLVVNAASLRFRSDPLRLDVVTLGLTTGVTLIYLQILWVYAGVLILEKLSPIKLFRLHGTL